MAIVAVVIAVPIIIIRSACDGIRERKLAERGQVDPSIDLLEIIKTEGELIKEKKDYERRQAWLEEKLILLRIHFKKKFPHVDENALRAHLEKQSSANR